MADFQSAIEQVVLRELVATDAIHPLLSIAFEGFPDMWKPLGVTSSNAKDYVVADADGALIGMLHGYRRPDRLEMREPPSQYNQGLEELEVLTQGTWFIQGLAIVPSWRDRGIGTNLMTTALERAARSGASCLSAIVPLVRNKSVRFYEKRGFKKRGERGGLYSLGFPVTYQLMVKE